MWSFFDDYKVDKNSIYFNYTVIDTSLLQFFFPIFLFLFIYNLSFIKYFAIDE